MRVGFEMGDYQLPSEALLDRTSCILGRSVITIFPARSTFPFYGEVLVL